MAIHRICLYPLSRAHVADILAIWRMYVERLEVYGREASA